MQMAIHSPSRGRSRTCFARLDRWKDARGWVQFWAGFCLIANGAYLGVGWTMRAGDAGDLLRHGTPVGVMVLFGAVAFSAGLALWHLLGKREKG